METQKKRRGDRKDGRLLRELDSLHYITGIIYPNRCDNEAYIGLRVDLTPINEYLKKKNEGEELFPYLGYRVLQTIHQEIAGAPIGQVAGIGLMLLQCLIHTAQNGIDVIAVVPNTALLQLGHYPLLYFVFQLLQRLVHTGIVQVKGLPADLRFLGQLRDIDLEGVLLVQQ